MPKLTYPFEPFIAALKAKDADLFERIGHLPGDEFYSEWVAVHPEDFPKGLGSELSPSSIVPAPKGQANQV